jgi:hypothetical protein
MVAAARGWAACQHYLRRLALVLPAISGGLLPSAHRLVYTSGPGNGDRITFVMIVWSEELLGSWIGELLNNTPWRDTRKGVVISHRCHTRLLWILIILCKPGVTFILAPNYTLWSYQYISQITIIHHMDSSTSSNPTIPATNSDNANEGPSASLGVSWTRLCDMQTRHAKIVTAIQSQPHRDKQ